MNDPFDQVLRRLGLVLPNRTQNINSSIAPWIGNTGIHVQKVPCRLRVRHPDGRSLLALADCPVISEQIILNWALQVVAIVHPTPPQATGIRPLDLILEQDGTVGHHVLGDALDAHVPGTYPSRYRIPPSTIANLPLEERVRRTVKFALGSLLYEILTQTRPFGSISSSEVQRAYRNGFFPDIREIRLQPLIYACWSAEFGEYLAQGDPSKVGLQLAGIAGAVVCGVALLAFPIIGAVGFGALGPVAGSAAAGWQASIGAVQAGSLFAFCQSAAMGGAAATTLIATGATGGLSAAAALAASGFEDPQRLSREFTNRLRVRRG